MSIKVNDNDTDHHARLFGKGRQTLKYDDDVIFDYIKLTIFS